MERILILFFLCDFLYGFIQSIFIETWIVKFLEDFFWTLILEVLVGRILAGLEWDLRFVEILKCWGVFIILLLLKFYDLFAAWIDLWHKFKGRINFFFLIFDLFSSEEVFYFKFISISVKTIKDIWTFFWFYLFLRFRNIRMESTIWYLYFRLLLSILFL